MGMWRDGIVWNSLSLSNFERCTSSPTKSLKLFTRLVCLDWVGTRQPAKSVMDFGSMRVGAERWFTGKVVVSCGLCLFEIAIAAMENGPFREGLWLFNIIYLSRMVILHSYVKPNSGWCHLMMICCSDCSGGCVWNLQGVPKTHGSSSVSKRAIVLGMPAR